MSEALPIAVQRVVGRIQVETGRALSASELAERLLWEAIERIERDGGR